MKKIFLILLLFSFSVLKAQQPQEEKKDLGGKEYMVVKAYEPILGESFKISDSPEEDTTSKNPPVLEYTVRPRKADTEFETSVIKAVKIKDETLTKLYHTYIKLGLGNYTTYAGDLYVNALRSKKGSVGLALNHFSGSPGLKSSSGRDPNFAGFSKNHGGVYGKYFFDHSTFSGNFDYSRDVVHYYGVPPVDTVISKNDNKQRFNKFGMQLGLASNYLTDDHLDYAAGFGFSTIRDLLDVTENDFIVKGKVGKQLDNFYLNADISLNYFSKTLAKNETITLVNDLKRHLITIAPTLSFNQDKVKLVLGVDVTVEKNLESVVHLFPKADITLPIAENILYAFAGVNGGVVKNTFQTMAEENPFVTSEVLPLNPINKLELKAGLNGSFSDRLSFMTMVKYSTIDGMVLYYTDAKYFNKYNVLYINGKVFDIHAELSYKAGEKFNASLRFDQYSYSMDLNEKAWHKPNSEVALDAKYNIWDKILVSASVYARGSYYARIQGVSGFTAEKVDGYLDGNLGLEYRYSKILSLYVNMNNLGFARYYTWFRNPSERLNVLGGITYSF